MTNLTDEQITADRKESQEANASLRAMGARLNTAQITPAEVPVEIIDPAAEIVPPVEVAPVVEPVAAPVVAPAATPEVKEFTYTYQIKDEDGTPVGAPQVRKYRSTQELPIDVFEDAIKAHTHATIALRNLKRKQTFEVPDPALANAERFNEGIVEFKPRTLTDDENFTLSQELLDPVKAPAARAKIMEAELGASAQSVGSALNRVQEKNLQLQAKLEVADFLTNNPTYYKSQDNFKKITDYMVVNNLDPVAVNFQRAYDNLLADGFLQTGPTVREAAPVQEVVPVEQANTPPVQSVPASGITSEAAVAERPVVGIPSGLNRSNSSDVGAPVAPRTYTKAEIDRMSSDDYKRLVVEPEFRARRAASRNQ